MSELNHLDQKVLAFVAHHLKDKALTAAKEEATALVKYRFVEIQEILVKYNLTELEVKNTGVKVLLWQIYDSLFNALTLILCEEELRRLVAKLKDQIDRQPKI